MLSYSHIHTKKLFKYLLWYKIIMEDCALWKRRHGHGHPGWVDSSSPEDIYLHKEVILQGRNKEDFLDVFSSVWSWKLNGKTSLRYAVGNYGWHTSLWEPMDNSIVWCGKCFSWFSEVSKSILLHLQNVQSLNTLTQPNFSSGWRSQVTTKHPTRPWSAVVEVHDLEEFSRCMSFACVLIPD